MSHHKDNLRYLRPFLEDAIRHEPRLWRDLLLEAEEWAPRAVVPVGLFEALTAMDVRTTWNGPTGSPTIAREATTSPASPPVSA